MTEIVYVCSTEHAYGWRNEPHRGAVVFHTSLPLLPMATGIEIEYGLADVDLPVFRHRIGINWIRLHRKLRYLRGRMASTVKRRSGA